MNCRSNTSAPSSTFNVSKLFRTEASQACGNGHRQIVVNTPDGETMTLNLSPSDSIDDVKMKIQARNGSPTKEQILQLNDGQLATTEKMIDRGVVDLTYNYLSDGLSEKRENARAVRKKRLAQLYDQLAVALIFSLDEYKHLKFKADESVWNLLNDLKLELMTLSTMPLINFAVHLVDLFEFQSCADQHLENPEKFDLLKGLVIEWLSNVDNHDRIDGALRPLWRNNEKCTAITELLILIKIYPSRTEILFVESGLESRQSGSLREEIVMGRRMDLMTAMDALMEILEMDVSKRSSSDESANIKKAWVFVVWSLVDLDGDGVFSQDESRELCRVLLARASLGRLLMTHASHEYNIATPMERASLISTIPPVVLSFVEEGIESIALALWQGMDKDLDGEVTKEEFLDLFLDSLWTAIVVPLRSRLADNTKKGRLAEKFKPAELPRTDSKARRNCHCAGAELKSLCFPEEYSNSAKPGPVEYKAVSEETEISRREEGRTRINDSFIEEFTPEENLEHNLVEHYPNKVKQPCGPCEIQNTSCELLPPAEDLENCLVEDPPIKVKQPCASTDACSIM